MGDRRFDIRWIAPKAEGSFNDARGDIVISHDYITVNSSSVAFELYTKVRTSYPEEYWLNENEFDSKISVPFTVEGIELDLRMRGFEFFSLVPSYPFDSPRPTHLKATGKVKFQGKVLRPSNTSNESAVISENDNQSVQIERDTEILLGEISVSGLRLNQLMLAPQLGGQLSLSRNHIKAMTQIFLYQNISYIHFQNMPFSYFLPKGIWIQISSLMCIHQSCTASDVFL